MIALLLLAAVVNGGPRGTWNAVTTTTTTVSTTTVPQFRRVFMTGGPLMPEGGKGWKPKAFIWLVVGTVHGVSVSCDADVYEEGSWSMECRGRTDPVRLDLAGYWKRLGNGDLEFTTPYANARMVFRQAGTALVQAESNVDVHFTLVNRP